METVTILVKAYPECSRMETFAILVGVYLKSSYIRKSDTVRLSHQIISIPSFFQNPLLFSSVQSLSRFSALSKLEIIIIFGSSE